MPLPFSSRHSGPPRPVSWGGFSGLAPKCSGADTPKKGGGGTLLWEGVPNPLPRPLLWTVPPTFGGCGVLEFRVSFGGAPGPVAERTFGSQPVRFVAVYDVSGVPANNVVWPELPHFGECH